ncbi:uncharacterized protein LOC111377885 [Olea europaea var. sylvestris]|uniref:uncharacterized protein LOC111377885 n=1 Tax=Olea europaea var. sylvestris TaxID=158386 RepID=UPI000C1D6CAA|nr:uncharacterized protein LOC111377885 [Olea europaea var. sylvestris]
MKSILSSKKISRAIQKHGKDLKNASAGGSTLDIPLDNALELFERIAENQSMWPSNREVQKKTIGCGEYHITTSCPLASIHISQPAEVSYAQNYQRQNRPYTYNSHSSLNKHPNYAWVDNSDQVNQMKDCPPAIQQQEEKMQSLEDLLVKYITKTKSVGQIATALANRAQGTLLNDTEKNLNEQVLAVEAMNYATIETPSIKLATPVRAYVPPIPFPLRLQRQSSDARNHILKEMLTKKRNLPEHETITLSEECSAIIQHRIPPKLKDPESFTLPCSIGNLNDINYLVDSGASISSISLPLCRKLGLGDLKAASIILQLAKRSLKHPYGIDKDTLIKAGSLFF